MSLSHRGLRAASVREDEAALAQIVMRLQKLDKAQAAADAVLADATRAAEDLARETRQLRDVESNMAAKLALSRAALVEECVMALPEDVLRCVFAQVVDDGAPDAPFALAAVCSRWRRVALDSASLWATIHLLCVAGLSTEAQNVLSTEYDRAVLLLSRSRSAPLDIKGPSCLFTSDQILNQIRRIISLLGAHVARWKIASLSLPNKFPSSSLDFLKGPTPLLVELTICGNAIRPGENIAPPGGGFLPFAPRLQHLSFTYQAGVGCSTRHGFPAMKKLSFRSCACTDDQVLDLVRMSGQCLEELILDTPLTHGPRNALHLPNLNYLCISRTSEAIISAPTPLITTPALAHLNLGDVADITDTFIPFLDAIATTVRRLTVEKPLSRSSLLALAHLRNLERLDFNYCVASFASDEALDVLCDDPPVWPRLQRVRNLVFRTTDGASSEAILRFIASRTCNLPEGNERTDVARPCKLREVTMKPSLRAPQWLLAEVKRLVDS